MDDRRNSTLASPHASDSFRVSVVIAAWNGEASLERCLASLPAQACEAEVIVACNFNDGALARFRSRFPPVRFVPLSPQATVPLLRAAGITCSSGDLIALAEDHCTFHESWYSELRKAHEAGHAIVGGAVENASPGALAWAVYFCDYGVYMLPARAAVATSLSGMNASYRRTLLQEVEASWRDGFSEAFVHQELRARGHQLYFLPSAIVYHGKRYRFGTVLPQFFHLARSYAATRLAGSSPARRLLFALGSLLLPILLPARVVMRTLGKGRHLGELLLSLPYVLLLSSSWSLGEFCGYLAGPGGSAGKWR